MSLSYSKEERESEWERKRERGKQGDSELKYNECVIHLK